MTQAEEFENAIRNQRVYKLGANPLLWQIMEELDLEGILNNVPTGWVVNNGQAGMAMVLTRRARRLEIKERIYPHLFRHTFSADFLRSGGDMYILSQILGHADPSFTKKFYAGFDIEPQKREHEKHTPLYQYMTLLEKVFTAFGQIVAGVEADEEGKAADDADEPEES